MFKTLVISLSDEKERRKAIKEHLKDIDIGFEFFDAIDGRKMDVLAHPDYNSKKRCADTGMDLKPGELGCLLSHKAAYEAALKSDSEFVLLLEDDARLHKKTKKVLESLIAKNFDFDIIRLLGSPKVARGKHRKIINLLDDFWLVRLRRIHGGAHATLFSRSGLQKALKATENFAHPIDTILSRTWETGIQSYCIQPGLAVQDTSFDSAIGAERHDKKSRAGGLARASFFFTRAGFKFAEAIGKAKIYYGNAPKDLAARKKFG